MFVERLRRKAESAGGRVNEFPTYHTKLSQYCHKCGEFHKKSLSQRVHTCCDLNIQRDVYSAFLALSVKDNNLDVKVVNQRFGSMETMLRAASLSKTESQAVKVRRKSSRVVAQGECASHSFCVKTASERLVCKVDAKSDKAQDVVAEKQLLLFTL